MGQIVREAAITTGRRVTEVYLCSVRKLFDRTASQPTYTSSFAKEKRNDMTSTYRYIDDLLNIGTFFL